MSMLNEDKANPLNTYLSTRPSFASPEPLAAAAGLTIPLKITLSNIKLSAFIILVFSKQKGLTLVFRNDPLESLKVSSTFDSIPFVRDYLQRTIESQLRTLLMDEVPAIIHRLSLRLWVPEYREKEEVEPARDISSQEPAEEPADPLASPPQDPVDLSGRPLDANHLVSLSLDSATETNSLFSSKNLIRLASLADSQRTLSLFTPSMQDVVYRAWSGSMERGESTGLYSPLSPPLSRKHSLLAGSSMASAFSDSSAYGSSRPPLSSFGTSFSGSSFGGKHGRTGRKRKHRVVNLRKPKTDSDDGASISDSATVSSKTSDSGQPLSIPEERELELVTPPMSPEKPRQPLQESPSKLSEATPRPPRREKEKQPIPLELPPQDPNSISTSARSSTTLPARPPLRPNRYFQSFQIPSEKDSLQYSSTGGYSSLAAPFPYMESHPGGILEQAWMMKMAGEIARRVQEQKSSTDFWGGESSHEAPPPAYGS